MERTISYSKCFTINIGRFLRKKGYRKERSRVAMPYVVDVKDHIAPFFLRGHGRVAVGVPRRASTTEFRNPLPPG